jgi:hypothetical protein
MSRWRGELGWHRGGDEEEAPVGCSMPSLEHPKLQPWTCPTQEKTDDDEPGGDDDAEMDADGGGRAWPGLERRVAADGAG